MTMRKEGEPRALSPAERVLDQGVLEALRRHKQAGNPVATWRNGEVVWVAPEDIPVDADPEADR